MTRKEAIEIPFGAEDSELIKWEYTIPEGMEAEIKDGKVIIKKAESEDERMKRIIMKFVWGYTTTPHSIINGDKSTLEYAKEVEAYLEKQKEHKPAEWSDYKDKVNVPYCSSKPEWSEEDELMMKAVIGILDESDHPKLCHWLKSLRPQPRQEWSEEDERTIVDLINYFEGDSLECSIEEIVQRIKSLRPSWKPSEQEKGALRTAISILTEERSFPKAAAHLQAILDAFDNKEARKDWKPSEEQMEALERCIDYMDESDNDDSGIMLTLYEQLKAL